MAGVPCGVAGNTVPVWWRVGLQKLVVVAPRASVADCWLPTASKATLMVRLVGATEFVSWRRELYWKRRDKAAPVSVAGHVAQGRCSRSSRRPGCWDR